MFDSIPFSLITIIAAVGLLLYWRKDQFSAIYHRISAVILRYSVIEDLTRSDVLYMLWRVLRLNWYSSVMIVVLWVILFKIDVGSDIVVAYVDNLIHYKTFMRIATLWSLFGCVLLMTIAIWTIPFFLYSSKRIDEAKSNTKQFYIGTKLLSILATLPFYVVANAFYFRKTPKDIEFWKLLVLSVAAAVIFTLFEFIVLKTPPFQGWLKRADEQLIVWGKKWLAGNMYLVILIKILIIEMVFVTLMLVFIPLCGKDISINELIAYFLLASSSTVFKLLFFTDDTKLTIKQVNDKVIAMTDTANQKTSRVFYWSVFVVLILVNGYYFIVPSLTATNTLYVVLCVFALLILSLDLFRNLASSEKIGEKIIGYTGILLFLWAPLTSPDGQFTVPLRKYEGPLPDESDPVSASKSNKSDGLVSALERRIAYINQRGDSSKIYVVCAMGGGSRAGYFTTRVLQAIEDSIPKFWDQTLLYSSISGSSVGIYHYLKTKTAKEPVDSLFLKHIYLQNYNSSGAFGFLLGDSFEGAFGGLFGKIWHLSPNSDTVYRYRDRNVRIRAEYEYALKAALAGAPVQNYYSTTFRNGISLDNPDAFRGFFAKHAESIPIHLVNTFEISTGRRTVLSPFVAPDGLFSNVILPLQDKGFSKNIRNEDIHYRDAVNLSELFPFLSAASTIGSECAYQFVDGGYFENYGLATGFDVVEYFYKHHPELKSRLKIILIKNSLQESKLDKKKRQLVAPLVGVINAPFTGHANHFLENGSHRYNGKFLVLKFNSDSMETKVPLTRALTQSHLTIMDTVAIKEVKMNVNLIR
jgi:hypothetical protein